MKMNKKDCNLLLANFIFIVCKLLNLFLLFIFILKKMYKNDLIRKEVIIQKIERRRS